jgi:GntR family transcriptional regulator
MSLPRVSGTSLHRQLFLVLRDQIVAGTLPEGAALPKEETLCEQFGVSRITVRRALSDLAAQGLVQRRHGIGTYVLPGAAPARAGLTLSFLDHLRRVGAETQVRVIDLKREVPAPNIAALLLLPPGEPAIHAVRLRSTGSIPLMVTDAWIPADLGQKITRAALEKKALFELLMHQGIRFGRVVQEISAESAPPQLVRLLATETGSALLRLVRLMHDRKERPVEYLTVHMTPERSRILMEISADAIDTLNAGHLVHDPALASQTTS